MSPELVAKGVRVELVKQRGSSYVSIFRPQSNHNIFVGPVHISISATKRNFNLSWVPVTKFIL